MTEAADFECLWAKSSDAGGLALIRHQLDVAAVAFELIETLPGRALERRAEQLGLDVDQAHRWLSALVGCHDLGKATPGFQNKWPPGRERAEAAGFPFALGAPDRHDAATSFHLARILRLRGLDAAAAKLLTGAVAVHHGFTIPLTDHAVQARFPLDAPWDSAQQWLVDTVFDLVGAHTRPTVTSDQGERADLHQWLAGLCSTSDWIGSSEAFFRYDRPRTALASWYTQSRDLARAALIRCGFGASGSPRLAGTGDALNAALPAGATARPLQQAVLGALDPVPAGPVLVVIEAPMGEGKTEAAFAVDAWLRSKADARGLYVAMPTQATSNALFGRLAAYLDRLRLPYRAEIQLAHGSADLQQTDLRLHEIGFGSADASVGASAWLAGAKRVMLAANAVGTVDQALVSVLNAKHHFVRHFGLADRHVVFDEVHAYDTYTGNLIERLLAWLRASGSSVVLMSATLPRPKMQGLLRQFGGSAVEVAPYPRISVVSSAGTRSFHVPARRRSTISLARLGSEAGDVVDKAVALAATGACVLVVANKVARAQDLFARIAARMSKVMLFHARFPMEQRLSIEAEVLRRFGASGGRREGWILVATQVVEQSLDVDFDALVTDLAPVDLLLQRIGRIHRHDRHRPSGCEQAWVYVSGLVASGELPPAAITSVVYDQLPVLRTAHWLALRPVLQLPDDIDLAVQWVYGSEPPQDASPVFCAAHETARREFLEQVRHEADLAEKAALALPHEWTGASQASPIDDEAASSGLTRFGTRLGDRSLSCIPVFRLEGGYSVSGKAADWAEGEVMSPETARALGRRHLRVSHRRLVRHLEQTPTIRGWDRQAALAGHVPLLLDANGEARLGALRVRLDPELGLVLIHPPRQGEPHV